MRTHGSRRQQEAVKSATAKQMKKVYEVKIECQNVSFFPFTFDICLTSGANP